MDASREGLVLESLPVSEAGVPGVATDRYYVLQLIDLLTDKRAYLGSRVTANGPFECYFDASRSWPDIEPVKELP
ncbi:hypothetical protein D3C87_121920 [compost metagenome]